MEAKFGRLSARRTYAPKQHGLDITLVAMPCLPPEKELPLDTYGRAEGMQRIYSVTRKQGLCRYGRVHPTENPITTIIGMGQQGVSGPRENPMLELDKKRMNIQLYRCALIGRPRSRTTFIFIARREMRMLESRRRPQLPFWHPHPPEIVRRQAYMSASQA